MQRELRQINWGESRRFGVLPAEIADFSRSRWFEVFQPGAIGLQGGGLVQTRTR